MKQHLIKFNVFFYCGEESKGLVDYDNKCKCTTLRRRVVHLASSYVWIQYQFSE